MRGPVMLASTAVARESFRILYKYTFTSYRGFHRLATSAAAASHPCSILAPINGLAGGRLANNTRVSLGCLFSRIASRAYATSPADKTEGLSRKKLAKKKKAERKMTEKLRELGGVRIAIEGCVRCWYI